ncbi:MAG: hypothetical protein AAF600_19760 [Bacteroidota bacterium]
MSLTWGASDFSGIAEKYTWEGAFVSGHLYQNGEIVGDLTITENQPSTSSGRTSGGYWQVVVVDWYSQACVGSSCGPWHYNGSDTKYVWVRDNQKSMGHLRYLLP